MAKNPSVIIIGAGASGIAAATKLLENGFRNLIVLEAENKIGGRVCSVEFGGSIVDLGGQWVHGEEGNLVYEKVKDLDLLSTSHNTFSDNTYYLSNGNIVDKYVTDRLFETGMKIINDKEGGTVNSGAFADYFRKVHFTAVIDDLLKTSGCLGSANTCERCDAIHSLRRSINSSSQLKGHGSNLASNLCSAYHNIWDHHNEFYKNVLEEFSNNEKVLQLAKLFESWLDKFFFCLKSESWNNISTYGAHVYQSCEGDQQLNWRNKGYRTILDVLMKKIPDATKQLPLDDKIFLKKEVTKIIWDNNTVNFNGVTVNCADGSNYNADHVIVTTSLGVLKNFHESLFIPELPSYKVNSIEGIGFGTVNKILLKFPTKWWPSDLKGFSLLWTDEDRANLRKKEHLFGPLNNGRSWLEDIFGFYVIDSHPRVLLSFVVGESSQKVELLSDELVVGGCMYLLRKFAGWKYDVPDADEILRSKWSSNPHFCGSYAHVSIKSENKKASSEDLVKPLVSANGKQIVLFAGEATNASKFSTVHGAIETGYREAERLINIYK